ncbi:DUF1080 domain-containing protein [Streptomyces sp. T1317-0309]|nr:DUF1080 domain-containing protein [Streptomyces sp. T1317-0309]
MQGELVVTEGGGSDTTPPQTSAQVTGAQNAQGEYVGAATVTIAATDEGGSGVDRIEYAIGDTGAWQPYTAPVVVDRTGGHKIRHRALDKAGNVSAEKSVEFTVVAPPSDDTAPPETSATVSGERNADGEYIDMATVTVTASDTGSGQLDRVRGGHGCMAGVQRAGDGAPGRRPDRALPRHRQGGQRLGREERAVHDRGGAAAGHDGARDGRGSGGHEELRRCVRRQCQGDGERDRRRRLRCGERRVLPRCRPLPGVHRTRGGRPCRRPLPRLPGERQGGQHLHTGHRELHGRGGRRCPGAQLSRVRRAVDGDRGHGRLGCPQPGHEQPVPDQRADRGREGVDVPRAVPQARAEGAGRSPDEGVVDKREYNTIQRAARQSGIGKAGQTEGYRKIFDGSPGSLAKWEQVGGGSFALNTDGSITSGTTKAGLGMLWFPQRKYGDFSLKLQWRDDAPGTGNANAGVSSRSRGCTTTRSSRDRNGSPSSTGTRCRCRPARRRHVQDGLDLRFRPGGARRGGGHPEGDVERLRDPCGRSHYSIYRNGVLINDSTTSEARSSTRRARTTRHGRPAVRLRVHRTAGAQHHGCDLLQGHPDQGAVNRS